MNFFENELKRIIEPLSPEATYVGRTCYIRLDDQLRAKVYFDTSGYADHYPVIRVAILNRTEGLVDNVTLHLSDLMGQDRPDGERVYPRLWETAGKVVWQEYEPKDADYKAVRQALKDYLGVWKEVE